MIRPTIRTPKGFIADCTKREGEACEINEAREKAQKFRVLRLFRLFRILSSSIAAPCEVTNPLKQRRQVRLFPHMSHIIRQIVESFGQVAAFQHGIEDYGNTIGARVPGQESFTS